MKKLVLGLLLFNNVALANIELFPYATEVQLLYPEQPDSSDKLVNSICRAEISKPGYKNIYLMYKEFEVIDRNEINYIL